MPNCDTTKHKCGVACTEEDINIAYYKDCETGRIGSGATYTEAIQSATKKRPITPARRGITAAKRIHPLSKVRTIGSGDTKTGPSGKLTVPVGSRFDDKEKNWIDTEKLLGDPEPDNDPGTVGGFDNGDCFGLPMECGSLAVIGGAILVLILVMKIF